MESQQIVYVTNSTDMVFLSRAACIDLGLISKDFPTLLEMSSIAVTDTNTHAIDTGNGIILQCGCPRHKAPPPRPTTLPIPATEENREALQCHLVELYASSTFNTFVHQPLPMMSGPPMHLMVAPDAKPIAHHTPIPVALRWQYTVKVGLDQDVRMGASSLCRYVVSQNGGMC